MGYTHYWTQRSDYTVAGWKELAGDVLTIINAARKRVPLANWEGDPGTYPEVSDTAISFNGVGDDAHETFLIPRKRPKKASYHPAKGWSFCKTAGKPYDVAVTAVLTYLGSCHKFSVSSDGDASDWAEGVNLARAALPRSADRIDVPEDVRESAHA